MNRIYMCIDLKSFYASVECRERGLDPLNTNLVVADPSRTEKTICLAVSPSLKQYGIPGRARLFEVVTKVKELNTIRLRNTTNKKFIGSSYLDSELKSNKDLKLDYIVAPPQMRKYMKYSTDIYKVYLKYLSKEDIYVYSIDEVFCDITNYLKLYKKTPKELTTMIIQDVLKTTGITATAGIGTNMYLAKVAMDIVAKHTDADEYGVRLAEIDELSYRKILWNHRPLTDFWRIGKGIATKLELNGMHTLGDVARMSLNNEDFLYKLFGVNAELLIDHAWGYEPCTIKSVKSYTPTTNSLSSGQVLHEPYTYMKARLIVREMMDSLACDLTEKGFATSDLTLTIGYDIDNLTNPKIYKMYNGPVVKDFYGRLIPKHSHGTIHVDHKTNSSSLLCEKIIELFDHIANPILLVRRINIAACNLVRSDEIKEEHKFEQVSLFQDYEKERKEKEESRKKEKKDMELQKTIVEIKHKYGKNAILKGMNFEEGGTMRDRNMEVGGHRG